MHLHLLAIFHKCPLNPALLFHLNTLFTLAALLIYTELRGTEFSDSAAYKFNKLQTYKAAFSYFIIAFKGLYL